MKLYSDKLTTQDIYSAARRAGVAVFHCERIASTRIRKFGWTISLEGSSPYTSQSSFCEPHKAATWSEHGVWMAELYKLDPQLRISWYKTLGDFLRITKEMHEHPGNNIGKRAAHYRAPWLNDPELRLAYLREELRAERISYGDLVELQSLVEHIDPSDVELLEAAGVPEYK